MTPAGKEQSAEEVAPSRPEDPVPDDGDPAAPPPAVPDDGAAEEKAAPFKNEVGPILRRMGWTRVNENRSLDWNATLRDPDVVAYQPPALAVENRPLPFYARAMVYLILMIVVVGLTWASLATMDMTVMARGRVVTDRPSITLQPLETTVIREINVTIGDRVKAGEVVAALDPTFSTADLTSLREQKASLQAQHDRVRAELMDDGYAPEGPLDDYTLIQRTVFENHQANLAAERQAVQAEIDALAAKILQLEEDLGHYREQLETVTEHENMYRTLEREGVGSRVNLLDARRIRQEVERQIDATVNEISAAMEDQKRARAKFAATVTGNKKDLADELMDVRSRLANVDEEITKAQRRQDMVTLRAPVDSRVVSVTDYSVGSVLRTAEPVVSLVPDTAKFEALVQIPAEDIRGIEVGSPVRLKLDAFPFQKFGIVNGEITAISADAEVPDNRGAVAPPESGRSGGSKGQGAFYRARVSMNQDTADDRISIMPGMGVNAEIRVGERTVLSYFLYPILRTMDESFQDR